MKRYLAILMILVLALAICGCGKSPEVETIDGLIEEAKQELNPDIEKLNVIYNLYSVLSEEDKAAVEDIEYIMSIERFLVVEAAIEEANTFFEEKKFKEAIEAIDNARPFANEAQNEEIEALLNTICYPNTTFIRLENFIIFDKDGNAIPWEDDRVFSLSHDVTSASDGEFHLYGFWRANNSLTDAPAYKFQLYLPDAYESKFESVAWTGTSGVSGQGLVYYDDFGNRMYYVNSVDDLCSTYEIFIQYAEYVD